MFREKPYVVLLPEEAQTESTSRYFFPRKKRGDQAQAASPKMAGAPCKDAVPAVCGLQDLKHMPMLEWITNRSKDGKPQITGISFTGEVGLGGLMSLGPGLALDPSFIVAKPVRDIQIPFNVKSQYRPEPWIAATASTATPAHHKHSGVSKNATTHINAAIIELPKAPEGLRVSQFKTGYGFHVTESCMSAPKKVTCGAVNDVSMSFTLKDGDLSAHFPHYAHPSELSQAVVDKAGGEDE